MKIRKARKGDEKQFIKLAKKADQRPEYWSKQKFTKFIKGKGNLFLFAEEKNKLIGYVGLKKKDKDNKIKKIDFDKLACIAWIAVLPDYRKKSIGSRLLKRAENFANNWGEKGLWLDCRSRVLNFYERNGYKIKGYIMKEDKGKKFRKYFLEKRLR